MAINILLPLIGVPSPTAVAAIEKCVRVAASFEAEITALAVEEDVLVRSWDHSAPAARAVGDALSMLRGARDVQVITATDENTPAEQQSGAELVRHLAEHGIEARFETVRIDGSSVGKIFEALVRARAADLLVMGAYGHSRLNEWVWGGMTKTVIGRPPCWVIMSH